MGNYCKTVTLRTRKIKKGTQLSMYLDYYPGYRDEVSKKVVRHESLGIYIYAKPRTRREREFNDLMWEKAEAIRCRRFESIVNERYDFFDKGKMKASFLDFFNAYVSKKSKRDMQAYQHFALYTHENCSFMEVDLAMCNGFREYLLAEAVSFKSRSKTMKLHINTAALYWSTFREVLQTAFRNHYLQEDVNQQLDNLKKIPTEKEHLSQEELYRLANTPCRSDVLKKAFLFSCLTGLRFSDVKALTWDNIKSYGNGCMCVKIRIKKTKQVVSNPISSEALELIGYEQNRQNSQELVFPGLRVSLTQTSLPKWLSDAGINKNITYHCSRHTFASLQVDAGTSIYVVQKMMAHKNVSTTQIYSELSDYKKRETIDRITLKPRDKSDDKCNDV